MPFALSPSKGRPDKYKSVRPEPDRTTGETTSHLTKAASCQVIGYSHPTRLSKNANQVVGYVEGYRI
jgi:hypothetical protein